MQQAREFIDRYFKTAMTIWALGVTVVILWGFHDLRAQSNAIQASRVHSCQENYRSVRRIFKPFLTNQKDPKVRQFNRTIHRLVGQCTQQTKPHQP